MVMHVLASLNAESLLYYLFLFFFILYQLSIINYQMEGKVKYPRDSSIQLYLFPFKVESEALGYYTMSSMSVLRESIYLRSPLIN